MDRSNEFNKTKIMEVSTNYSVVNAVVDSFGIEKVKLRFTKYDAPKDSIDIYVDFSTMILYMNDMITGRMLKQIESSPSGLQLVMGGSKSSKRLDGKPESKILSINNGKNKRGETVYYLNAVESEGRLSETGLIIPTAANKLSVSVSMSEQDLRELFIYIGTAIQAYMPTLVNKWLKAAEENRMNYNK